MQFRTVHRPVSFSEQRIVLIKKKYPSRYCRIPRKPKTLNLLLFINKYSNVLRRCMKVYIVSLFPVYKGCKCISLL